MVSHDMDLSGLSASFRRYCSSLNAQRGPTTLRAKRSYTRIVPYPNRSLPFRYFLPFGCKATVLKGAATRKANKLDPRERGANVHRHRRPFLAPHTACKDTWCTCSPGQGTVMVSTHTKFDLTYFPARRTNKRVKDFFTP